ncbi:MAG: hypothetical protein WC504_08635 [Methylobacter sp.]
MNFTKSILLTVIYSAVLLAPAMAVADDPDSATFQADKDRQIANVLEKVQIAQKNLSCVQAAQDHAALKVCEETFKQDYDVSETKVKAQTSDKKAPKGAKNKEKQ